MVIDDKITATINSKL